MTSEHSRLDPSESFGVGRLVYVCVWAVHVYVCKGTVTIVACSVIVCEDGAG